MNIKFYLQEATESTSKTQNKLNIFRTKTPSFLHEKNLE
jgi:hypothetical protein